MSSSKRASKGDKRAAFKAAVALARTTQKDFADAKGVTVDHLVLVLRGKRISPRLTREIDLFITKHLPEVGAELLSV